MGGPLVLYKANKTSNKNNIGVRNMRHIWIPHNMHLSLKSWQITLQLQLAQPNQHIPMSKIRQKKKRAVLHLKIKVTGRIIIFHDLVISRNIFFLMANGFNYSFS